MNAIDRINKIEELLIRAHHDVIVPRDYKVIGYQYNYYHHSFGDLSDYLFSKLDIKELIAPKNSESNNLNRPGTIKEKTYYVCVHDTASSAKTADAYAHARYVSNGGGGTSWHYSCGDDAIYHQIPDDEVAYHAGDSTDVPLRFYDTGVKASSNKPFIEIIDNYFYLNGIKSNIPCPNLELKLDGDELRYYSNGGSQKAKVPEGAKPGLIDIEYNNSMINTEGLRTIIGDNGNYFMGSIYYNKGFGFIANRGGNLHSIGIETMVNEGSNVLRTWHNCAKLVSKLLVDNKLTVDDVKPHHFFSGKPCPYTMRLNKEWDHFIRMVDIEYQIRLLLGDNGSIELIKADGTNDGVFDKEIIKPNISYTVSVKIENEEKIIKFVTKSF